MNAWMGGWMYDCRYTCNHPSNHLLFGGMNEVDGWVMDRWVNGERMDRWRDE